MVAVVISTRPPGTLCRSALSTRFATRLSTRRGSPAAGAGAERAVAPRCLRSARVARTPRATTGQVERLPPLDALLAAGQGEQRLDRAAPAPRRARAPPGRRPAASRRSASGSASATWSRVRSAVSGVRSSWEALATKCRCDSNDASSRSNRSSRVLGQLGELVVAPGPAQPAVQVAGGDVPRGRGDGAQRPQEPAGDQPARATIDTRTSAARPTADDGERSADRSARRTACPAGWAPVPAGTRLAGLQDRTAEQHAPGDEERAGVEQGELRPHASAGAITARPIR